MDRRLLHPGWLMAHVGVVALVVLFVLLGMWQLDRLSERRDENAKGESRLAEEPVEVTELLEEAGEDLDSIVYRPALATGTFDPTAEVLIRSQVHQGNAGFHVVTPLVEESGHAVLFNRGWIPLVLDEVPVVEAPPPSGIVTVEGWVHLSQERPPLGPEDPSEGRLTAVNRVDIDRIQKQVQYPLASVYLVEIRDEGGGLPIPVDVPSFDDEGPHLGYAIQWFGFALVLVVGWIFFARRQLLSGTRAKSSTTS